MSFVALLVGVAGEANTSTSRVQVPSISGVNHMEIVGTTNTMVNSSVGANAGQWVMVQFLGASSSSVTTLIPKAPADGTIVTMRLMFDGSGVTVDGL